MLGCHRVTANGAEGWPNTAARLAGGEWPSRLWFCTCWPDGAHQLLRSGADLLLKVHKTSSWATSRKEDMAWYCCRPMPTLWSLPLGHINHFLLSICKLTFIVFFYVSAPYGKDPRQNASVYITLTWQIIWCWVLPFDASRMYLAAS